MPDEDVLQQNRRSWNAVVPVHASHRPGLAELLRAGGTTLFPEEQALLGDVRGATVVHLLCNAGQDTLSLAAAGARVTGVDLSDEAITQARRTAAEAGLVANFERADVLDWLRAAREPVDVAFGSYGVVCWLPDLAVFARGIAGVLRPGGRFVLVDFHPVAATFDRGWRHAHPYPAGGEPLVVDGVGDYVGDARGGLSPGGFAEGLQGFRNPHPCTLYRWGLGELVTALAGAGLVVERLEEYPFTNGERQFDGLRELPGRRLVPPAGVPALPLLFGVVARRPG